MLEPPGAINASGTHEDPTRHTNHVTMGSIAKKRQPVKRQKRAIEPPRYTIRKDSLNRRYALDKRTGKRVSLFKAEKEREQRKRAAVKSTETFRRITHQKRSAAAKKGWETRRRKVILERPPSFAAIVQPLIPPGMKMRGLGGIADRSALYPKVAAAADRSWINLQVEAFAQLKATSEGKEPPPILTPRFDRLYGDGHGAHIRYDYFARAENLEDIDQMVDMLEQDEDNEYRSRELYTLYFSPEVA